MSIYQLLYLWKGDYYEEPCSRDDACLGAGS